MKTFKEEKAESIVKALNKTYLNKKKKGVTNTKKGRCKTKDVCILNFRAFDTNCCLSFGINTKFNFKYISKDSVKLERKHVDIIISKERFVKLFEVC